MSTKKLSNIQLNDFRKFLRKQGLSLIKESKGRGGHEKWVSDALERPVTIQSHIDPVPEFIIKQVLRYLKMSKEEFFKEMDQI
jgi:lambda repressor-like predicted transcriptional regulator